MRHAIITCLAAFTLIVPAAAVPAVPAAPADIVTTSDGRTFQGEIVSDTESGVTIDAMIAGIRAKISLSHHEIASIERKPVPDGFFDPKPASPRVSKRSDFSSDDELYIEIPIDGVFGQQIFAQGINSVLAYAKRHGIEHIVFTINSSGGGLEEASRTYALLKRWHEDLTFHAIVRDCRGAAVTVAIWCDTIVVAPGATLGGSPDLLFDVEASESNRTRAVVQAQIANEVSIVAEQMGRDADVVLAMFDPTVQLAIWLGEDGTRQKGAVLDPNVSPANVVFENNADQLLVLDEDQLLALGVGQFNGLPSALGETLGIPNWKRESEFGRTAMAKVTAREQRKIASAHARFEDQVQTNITRRNKSESYIFANLDSAAMWNPFEGSYSSYNSGIRTKRGLVKIGSSGSQTWTKDSRNDWVSRTDTALAFLRKAGSGVSSMRRLDKEAIELGLETTFDDGQLSALDNQIRAEIAHLETNRNRRGG